MASAGTPESRRPGPLLRGLALGLALLCAAVACAQRGSVALNSFPTIGVADGHTTIVATAEVRTSGGRTVPDGTQVFFTTTLGVLREPIVRTQNGIAQTRLTAPSIPGIAHITASAAAFDATGSLDIEFVADRAMLSRASDYIEVVAPKSLRYSSEFQAITANAANRGASLRHRDIAIDADDLQLLVNSQEVRAQNARLRLAGKEYEFSELYFKLRGRSGVGVTTVTREVPEFRAAPPLFGVVTHRRPRLALVTVGPGGVQPSTESADAGRLKFADLSEASVFVGARKIVVIPGRTLQFHKADVVMGGTKVLSTALFQLSLNAPTPIITDQFLTVSGNELAIDVPYYLSLKPGETSLLRLRSGTRYSTGIGAAGGTFVDYEMRWSHGDESQGGLTLSGMNRRDWRLAANQFLRWGERTTAGVRIDVPAAASVFTSGNLTHQLGGWQAGLNANYGRSLRGGHFENQLTEVSLERDPTKLGNAPLHLTYGVAASTARLESGDFVRSDQRVALRSRLRLTPQPIAHRTTLNASLSAGHIAASSSAGGATWAGSATIASALSRNANGSLTYDYLEDGFTSPIIGRHRLSVEGYWNPGIFRLSVVGSKSLDRQLDTLHGDLSIRLGPSWRLGANHFRQVFSGSAIADSSVVLGYQIGYREVGLSWSTRTKRLGIELMGARF